jgi:hypothetical protein
MPQPLELARRCGGVLLVCCQTHTLLHDGPGGVVLEVEQLLRIPSQLSHPSMEVRALEVRHGLNVLLPYGVLLIPNWEKRDRQCRCSCEAVLALGGEGDVRHYLNTGIWLAADVGPWLWVHGVKGYDHANLTPDQVVNPGQSATVDRSNSIVAKTDECIV